MPARPPGSVRTPGRLPFWGRLATRIYLVGLAQILVVFAGFVAILIAYRPEPRAGHEPGLLPPFGGPPPHGPRWRPPPDRPPRPDGPALEEGPPPGGPPAGLPPAPPPIERSVVPLVLLVVGVSSFLLARSLTKPLSQLSDTARRFGAGELGARTGLARRDELGDVAAAFDEMAERVNGMIRSEKELIANVSHELRTPLARIRVALDLASEGDAAMAREALIDIRDDLDELEKLISDVLMAARLDLDEGAPRTAGLPPLKLTRVAPSELCERSAGKFRSAHPERELALRCEEELPALEGDGVLLRRVIDNLLENAHKYSEAPAPIELAAQRDGAFLELVVADRGVGVSREDLPKVFRPFFRADKSRTRKTGGIGLGLALARRIVEAHDGTIALEPRDGGGTRAIVRLPIR